ncbi:DUF5519 family protein [Methylobacterium sp. E-005]|uniref:luciferase domain-containing protein n=1 Tax=Methylobacterium sp. E-005 TaxID=2836549 RepID=UPI001FB94394|nr:luciferase family protein [Methylobacterium sp. E-005]MCJ2088142.1 DUF5519 family protein [Methylobacterium sp. E-005]
MKLRNPGPVQPAPALQGPAGELAEAISRWPGVAAFTHWELGSPGVVDGAEFHIGDPELGHIHLDGTAHIPFGSAISALLVQDKMGRTPSWGRDWITYPVRSSKDVQHAAWLFGLAYARMHGTSDEDVRDRITERAKVAE